MTTPFALSSQTQAAIQRAQSQGPGAQNANYFAAYNGIYNDILAYNNAHPGSIDPGTLNWFSQAGQVNQQQFVASAPGTFIWAFTKAAAANEGVTLTNADLQTGSNAIFTAVANQLSQTQFMFDPSTFTPQGIIKDDASTGLKDIFALHPNSPLDYAIWGGTLFATTELNDPTYFTNYNIDLTPGSKDCNAILAGLGAGVAAVYNTPMRSGSAIAQAFASIPKIDVNTIAACEVEQQPSLNGYEGWDLLMFGDTQHSSVTKYDDLSVALDTTVYNPNSQSALTTAWSKVQTDFAGYYAIQPGDTWASLNAKYGTSGTTLQDMNNMSGLTVLQPGQVINISLSVSTGTLNNSGLSGLGTNAGFYDISTGQFVTASQSLDGSTSGTLRIGNQYGQNFFTGSASQVSGVSTSGGSYTINLSDGDSAGISSGGTVSFTAKGTTLYTGSDDVNFTGTNLSLVQPGSGFGGVGIDYTVNADGSVTNPVVVYQPFTLTATPSYGSALAGEQALAPEVTNDILIYSPTGGLTNQNNFQINVSPVGSGDGGNVNGDNTDAGGAPIDNQGNEYLVASLGVSVSTTNANTPGAFNASANNNITGNLQIGQAQFDAPSQNLTDLVTGAAAAVFGSGNPFGGQSGGLTAGEVFAQILGGYLNGAPNLADTDPLLIDLTGNGIQLTNWIDNATYFDTNLNAAGTGADGMQHHTSWVNSGTGILALDLNGDGKIGDITETLSEYFAGGSTPYHYADGLAALASLSTSTTVFSRATSKTDAKTGKLFWDEIVIAQGLPDSTGALEASQLKTLATAGIASISLVGSGNNGENIAGSAVTNRSTATTTSGGTDQVAAVSFQTDTAGDITYTQNGGVVINSSSEGAPTTTSTYVDQNASARTLTLSGGTPTTGGTLKDSGGNTVATGLNAVFASTQNDTITVASGDTANYWLGGGIGAATLNGGAGNTVFVINHQTVVNADYTGTNFNIGEVNDSAPISVDLGADHLQQVVGGAGDGTFNASNTTWNVYIQGGAGNNIIIGGAGRDALAGGTGNDLIEAGPGGSVIHAGSGNDVIYGGSVKSGSTPNSDVIYGGSGSDTVVLGTNNTAVYAGTGTMTIVGNDTQHVGSPSGPLAFSIVHFAGSYANYKLVHNADGSTTITNNQPGQNGAVTLENVTDIGFSDLQQLPLTGTGALPVNDTVYVSGSGPYVIQASSLLANDQDYSGLTPTISGLESSAGNLIARGGSGPVMGGTVSLSTDGTAITFVPTAGFSGVPSFRYYVQDGTYTPVTVQQYDGTGKPVGNGYQLSGIVSLVSQSQPTDPGFAGEWYLQTADVLPAWAAGYTGAGISVGVFDPSGNVDFSNPDLMANEGQEYEWVANPQGTSGSVQPGVGKLGTHATLVAGAIAAARDGEGDVGVAYNATLSSESNPSPTGPSTVFGVLNDWSKYAVVNDSWVTTNPYGDVQPISGTITQGGEFDALMQNAAGGGRAGLGTVIVNSAGNLRASGFNTEESSLTTDQEEITVGGVDQPADIGSLQLAPVPFSTPGASVLVSAPDSGINTTGSVRTNEYGQQFGSQTTTDDGTSFSAPIVTGVVALMLQANPNLGARDVQEILALTATMAGTNPTADANAAYTYNGGTVSKLWNGGGMHESYDYGFGEVDAAAAVRLALTWKPQDTFNNENFTLDQQSINNYVSENGIYNGGYSYNSGPGKGLSANNHGYTADSTGLLIPVASGTVPYIDFAVGSLPSASNLTAQHIYLTLNIAFPTLTNAATQLASANSLLGAMTVTLTSGDGTVSTLMSPVTPAQVTAGAQTPAGAVVLNGQTTPVFQYTFDTVRDWNENANQDYRVSVTYAAGTTSQGEIQSAQLQVFGDTSTTGTGQTHYYTDEFGSLSTDPNNAARGTLTDTGTGVVINASAVSTGTTLDLAANSSDSLIAGRGLTISSGTKVTSAFGGAGNDLFYASTAGSSLNGGAGTNTVSFSKLSTAVTANLTTKSITDNGATYTLANIENVTGTTAADNLTGDANANTLDGDGGADTLSGGGGNDTYIFGAGYGALTVVNGISSSSSPAGTLSIKAATKANQLWMVQSGQDLVLYILGDSTDQVTIKNWFANSFSQLSQIQLSDGSVILGSRVAAYVAAMAAYQQQNSSFNHNTAATLPTSLVPAFDIVTAQTIVGTGGSDSLIGSVGNNTIVGEQGNDTLTGGGGQNTYQMAAGDGQDTITNFKVGAAGDTLNLIGASAANVTTSDYALAGLVFANGSGTPYERDYSAPVNLNGGVIDGGGVGGGQSGYYIAGTGDLNHDGHSDLLWLPNTLQYNSQAYIYEMHANNETTVALQYGAPASKGYVGDFYGDGNLDVLYYDGTNTPFIRDYDSSGNVYNGGYIGSNTPGSYTVAAIGDFDGDGKSDILWVAATAGACIWYMNGTSYTYANVQYSIPNGAKVFTGDFLGTGQSDILVAAPGQAPFVREFDPHKQDGLSYNGGTLNTNGWLADPTMSGYSIAAVADFNGDGHPDILWLQNSGSAALVWLMNGLNVIGVDNLQFGDGTPYGTLPTVFAGNYDLYGAKVSYGANSSTILTSVDKRTLTSNNIQETSSVKDYSQQTSPVTASIATGATSVVGDSLYGFTGITGTNGADTLEGKGTAAAPSVLNGNGGADNYWINSGDGAVQINNGISTSNTAAGQVDFLGSINDETLWFMKSGNNLVADVIGTTDQVTVNNYYTSGDTYAQVSQIDASSLKLDTQLATLVQAMATYSANNSAFNPQTATAMPTDTNLQNAIAAAWHS